MTNYLQHQVAVIVVILHLIQPIRVSVINRVLAGVIAARIMSQSAEVSLTHRMRVLVLLSKRLYFHSRINELIPGMFVLISNAVFNMFKVIPNMVMEFQTLGQI